MTRAVSIVSVLVLGLVLAACGDDGGSASDGQVVEDLTAELLSGSSDDSEVPFTGEQASCFASGLVDEFGAEAMAEALQMDFDEFMAQAGDSTRRSVIDTLLDCVDFGAIMAAEVAGEISTGSAECVGDVFATSEAFRDALADSFVESGTDPLDDDAVFAEVFPSILECLTPEELAQLGGSGG